MAVCYIYLTYYRWSAKLNIVPFPRHGDRRQFTNKLGPQQRQHIYRISCIIHQPGFHSNPMVENSNAIASHSIITRLFSTFALISAKHGGESFISAAISNRGIANKPGYRSLFDEDKLFLFKNP